MIHLTLTGYYAGTVLCGLSKEEKLKRKELGETFAHAAYFANMVHPDLCSKCSQIWLSTCVECHTSDVEIDDLGYCELCNSKLDKQKETGRCGWCGREVLKCVCD